MGLVLRVHCAALVVAVFIGVNPACGQTRVVGGDPGEVEVCDGLDNDGDTRTDEADPLNGQPCGETDPSGCTISVMRCDNGRGMVCRTETVAEICDEKDNDCDHEIDEDLLCGISWPPPGDGGLPF